MAKQTFTVGQVLTAAQVTALQTNGYNQTVSTKTTSYVLVAADVGTRVYMNAVGATSVTVNTGQFAAGDTLWLGNIGAGACVVTAGTATVDKFSTASLTISQYQSAVLYFTSTGVSILYSDAAGASTPLTTKGDLFTYSTLNARLGVGANNTILTADSAEATGIKWAAPSAAGKSYSLINSPSGTALTGAATITYSGLSGYDSYVVIISGASSASSGVEIRIVLNGDTASNYNQWGVYLGNSPTYSNDTITVQAFTARANIQIGNMGSNQDAVVQGGVTITGANTSGAYKMVDVTGGGTRGSGNYNTVSVWKGYWNNTATITSIAAQTGGGNFDAGTMFIYGSA